MHELYISRETVPMIRTVLPTAVWESLALDYNGPYRTLKGGLLLVIADVYSRYLIVSPVGSTDFATLRKVLDAVFGHYGFPKTIKADNGPPFSGKEYASYLAQRSIVRVHSSPNFPQQNGLAERYMQVVNKAMQIAGLDNKGSIEMVQETVRAHNSAKHRVTNISPEELMLGRKVRRDLPLVGSTVSKHKAQDVRRRDGEQKHKSKVAEDKRRGAKVTKIEVGDKVVRRRMLRAKGDSRFDPEQWTVTAKFRGDLELEAQDGRKSKRNVTLVKKVHLPPYFKFPGQSSSAGQQLENQSLQSESGGLPQPMDIGEGSHSAVSQQSAESAAAKESPVSVPLPALRRSKRARKPTSRLNDYIK